MVARTSFHWKNMLFRKYIVAERCHSKFIKNLINQFFFFFHLVLLFYFCKKNLFIKKRFNENQVHFEMKNDMAGTAKVCFFLKVNFNYIVLFYLFIKKLQLTLVLNFFSSWTKIAIVDVCNTYSGYTESYGMRECHNIKTYKKTWNESWQHSRFPRETPALKALIYQFINKFINLSPAQVLKFCRNSRFFIYAH